MRTLFIHTESNEIPKYVESLASLGHETGVYMFRHAVHGAAPVNIDPEVLHHVQGFEPELIVYVGACGRCTKPSPKLFKKLNNEVAPCVLICSDAADESSPWWKELFEYDAHDAFRVMVAIDGNSNWPFHDRHLTALTPISPSWYPNPKRHSERTIKLGFAGNVGRVYTLKNGRKVGRKMILDQLPIQLRQRDGTTMDSEAAAQSYQGCVDFMLNTRIMPNFSDTGSFEHHHVKGRVVEAGLAGCLLLEPTTSPAKDWFEPGVDYIEYGGIADLKETIRRYIDDPDETEKFGFRLREKVLAEHTPAKFWGRVMERINR